MCESGHVKWRCGAAFTVAGVVGATLGSSLGKTFPGDKLITLFGVLMIVVALAMAVARPIGGNAGVRLDATSAVRLAPGLLLWGVVVGFMSGFFGIGGGFLAVPGLLIATDMPFVFAIGTSLISVAVFGLATATNYAVSGLVDWGVTALFLTGGVIGGFAGTRLARTLTSRPPRLVPHFCCHRSPSRRIPYPQGEKLKQCPIAPDISIENDWASILCRASASVAFATSLRRPVFTS